MYYNRLRVSTTRRTRARARTGRGTPRSRRSITRCAWTRSLNLWSLMKSYFLAILWKWNVWRNYRTRHRLLSGIIIFLWININVCACARGTSMPVLIRALLSLFTEIMGSVSIMRVVPLFTSFRLSRLSAIPLYRFVYFRGKLFKR